MKSIFITRKGLILLAQIVAALILVSVLLISQIGAFAGHGKSSSVSSSDPQITPTMLTASKTAEAPAPIEASAPPAESESNVGNPGINGNTPAFIACQARHQSLASQAGTYSNQANQLWTQINTLRNAAANSTDPTEATNLNAQADALQPEAERLNNLGVQMWQELFQGHRGVSCGPDGPVYND